MLALSPADWAVVLAAAVFTGLAKTAVPGLASIAVALYALVLPAKESTGVMLVLLLVGDVLAVWMYRRDADRALLARLVPSVVLGVLAGAAFLRWTTQDQTRRGIGVILLALVCVAVFQHRRGRRGQDARPDILSSAQPDGGPGDRDARPDTLSSTQPDGAGEGAPTTGGSLAPCGERASPASSGSADSASASSADSPTAARTSAPVRAAYGALAGFTTMVANAGGPVTSLYFLACRFSVAAFLGTTAWFFFTVNLVKLPFTIGMGLIRPEHLALDAVLAPVVVVAALVGRRLAARLPLRVFEPLVIATTVIAAVPLVL